jgi:hypothetical protein
MEWNEFVCVTYEAQRIMLLFLHSAQAASSERPATIESFVPFLSFSPPSVSIDDNKMHLYFNTVSSLSLCARGGDATTCR